MDSAATASKPLRLSPTPDVAALPFSRQRKSQIMRNRAGLCGSCSKPLGEMSKTHCDSCYERRLNAKGIKHIGKHVQIRNVMADLHAQLSEVPSMIKLTPEMRRLCSKTTILNHARRMKRTYSIRQEGADTYVFRIK